jgi:hypothetical protein
MRTPSALAALMLLGCRNDYEIITGEVQEVSLAVTSPTYGEFLGSEGAWVTGTVSPVDTLVVIEDQLAEVDDGGVFSLFVPVDTPYRIIEVLAHDQRIRVPVFSGHDPEDTWPGGISARITPAGLTRLGEEVGGLIDDMGWAELLESSLPTISDSSFGLTPAGITHDPSAVVLTGVDGGIDTVITLNNLSIAYDGWVDVLGYVIEVPVSMGFGTIGIGAVAVPVLDDERMLTLELTDATVVFDDPDITISVLEGWVLEWVLELVSDWIVEPLSELVLDLVLSQWGVIELGGPLAFDTDLLGTSIALEVAEVGGDPDGLAAGVAVGIDAPIAEEFTVASPVVSAGDTSHLELGLHEGLIDTMLSSELLGMLEQSLELSGSFGDMIGAGVMLFPGGDEAPEGDGWCLSMSPGTATVARLQPSIEPLAVIYIPDLIVNIGIQQGSWCEDWLVASLATEVSLSVEDGASLGLDIAVPEGAVLYYGASEYDEAEVVAAVGGYIGTMVSLLGGFADLDLSSMLGGFTPIDGMSPLSISITDSEPLLEESGEWTEGLYQISMDLWE